MSRHAKMFQKKSLEQVMTYEVAYFRANLATNCLFAMKKDFFENWKTLLLCT